MGMLGLRTKDILSDERTLYGRQPELDVVRGLSVFLMVGAHVFNQFTPLASESAATGDMFSGLTKLVGAFPGGAQCFMMVMGILILFSTRIDGRALMKRGLLLIVGGFLLEFLRILPGLVNLMITGDLVSFYPEYSYAEDWQLIVITLFWQDILIFAGMALVFLGFVIRFDISDIWLIVITAIMIVANQFLVGMDTGVDALNIFLGYFWGTTVFDGSMTTSRFPFLSWIIYPVAGYLIGKLLVRVRSKGAFYKTLGLWFLILSVPFFIIGLFTGMFETGFTGLGFYHQDALINIWCTLLSFDWIALMYFVSKRIPTRYLAHLFRWSRNITSIYVLHFVVLAVAIQILPRSFGIIGCTVMFLALFAFVDWLAYAISKRKRSRAAVS